MVHCHRHGSPGVNITWCHGSSWFTSWFVMVRRFTEMVCHGMSWFVMVHCHSSSWFVMVHCHGFVMVTHGMFHFMVSSMVRHGSNVMVSHGSSWFVMFQKMSNGSSWFNGLSSSSLIVRDVYCHGSL